MNLFSFAKRLLQSKFGDRGAVRANPLGDLIYVDSVNGNDGNNGDSRMHALLTLTRALAIAEAGDTIILNKGGSETVTASIAANLAGVKIVCPVDNPEQGFTVQGAGTLNLLTVSAANVIIEGLKLVHTGATASAAGILTTAAADRLHVKKCLFDDSAITTTFTGLGVSIIDAVNAFIVEDCIFKDIKFGVKYTIANAVSQIGSIIRNNLFFIGKSAAFGVATALTGSGAVKGAVIEGNKFLEANGDGSPATTAWDGTNGANATQGPIMAGAAFDQYLIKDNVAFTALADIFSNINAINAGCVGAQIGNKTALGADLEDFLAVATVDGSADAYMRDVIGKKADAAVTTVGTVASIIAYVKGIVNGLLGTQFTITGSVTSSAIPNNTQAAAAITGAASGNVIIEDIILETDATGIVAPTNLEITTDNAKGLTGAAAPNVLQAVSALGANKTVVCRVDSATKKLPFVLESTKKLYLHGDDAAGTGAGTMRVTIVCRRMSAGASLAIGGILT